MPGFDTANSTYIILNTASNVIFYFIPIFLAYTAAKALKCSTVVSMMLGAFLCHPTIDAMMQDTATHSTIFGLPVIKMAFTVGESSKIFTTPNRSSRSCWRSSYWRFWNGCSIRSYLKSFS